MEQYNKKTTEILENANHMKDALLKPVVEESSGGIISDAKTRFKRLEAGAENSIFEMAGRQGAIIQSTASNGIRAYSI